MTREKVKVEAEKCNFETHKVEFVGKQFTENSIDANVRNAKAVVTFIIRKKKSCSILLGFMLSL